MIAIAYAPDLVEETVLLAEPSMTAADRAAFRRERDQLYAVDDSDRRDDRFGELHRRWFVRLGAHAAVERAVAGRQAIGARLASARVVRAVARADEGADLVDRIGAASNASPLLVVRLRPSTLLDRDALDELLRHDLTHVEDMLDPAFGYERSLAPSDGGPLGDNILRDRYRVLWDVTIDGRLSRAGHADQRARAGRWREFRDTFPMLGDDCLAAFDDWFDRRIPTHGALASFVREPETAAHPSVRGV